MDIRIGNFFIKSDSVCFTLGEIRVIQEREGGRGIAPKPENIGKERESTLGYYATFKQALTALSSRVVMASDIHTVEEVLGALSALDKKIDALPEVLKQAESSI